MKLLSFGCGVLFALGLGLSGMTQPGKVTGFLDFTGVWDPSLAFVMAGAILIYSIGYRVALKRGKPVLAECYQIPSPAKCDRRLLLGAALFGVGWGLAGFCPGPALVSLVTLRWDVFVFVLAMIGGMGLFEFRASPPLVV